jgi:hypothetical protein
MKKWRIRSEIYEGDDPDPIVTHLFWADTREGAKEVMSAHMASDRFLNECIKKKLFSGRVPCRQEAFMEGPFG